VFGPLPIPVNEGELIEFGMNAAIISRNKLVLWADMEMKTKTHTAPAIPTGRLVVFDAISHSYSIRRNRCPVLLPAGDSAGSSTNYGGSREVGSPSAVIFSTAHAGVA